MHNRGYILLRDSNVDSVSMTYTIAVRTSQVFYPVSTAQTLQPTMV